MSRITTLHFFGGAGTVTGSNFLLESGADKILVDCGLFQGKHASEEANWAPLPYDPASIPFLIVTHAHVDHIGRIPRLVRLGFRGKILSTEATKALAGPLLLDSMELLQGEAARHNHELLYEKKDVERALSLWEVTSYHKPQELPGGFTLEFLDAGHILGAAMVRLTRGGRSIVLTGDLGGGNSPLISPADVVSNINYLVMESVYGDRVRHEDENRREMLENIIEETAARGGTLLIPAFSTERTQDLLFEIRTLMVEKRIPSMPVYVDSPLASKITSAYLAYPGYFSPEIRKRVEAGENIFSFPELRFTEGQEDSRAIANVRNPKIILAGSGMSNGGRVFSHQQTVLPDEKSTLLIVGYQAAGSMGRQLIEGAKEVRIFGKPTPVRCRVEALYGYSAHMDGEKLLQFVDKIGRDIEQVYVVMGEPSAAAFLVQRIRDYLGVRASAPEAGEKVTLDL